MCHPNKKYANQNTKYTNQSTKYTKQNTKYANQNTKYANKNNKYAIIKTTNTSTKRPSTPAKTPKKTPSTPIKTPNTPSKPVKNTDLRCLVAGQFLSHFYALFWCTIFKGLKMRWCTKKDKYEVWHDYIILLQLLGKGAHKKILENYSRFWKSVFCSKSAQSRLGFLWK